MLICVLTELTQKTFSCSRMSWQYIDFKMSQIFHCPLRDWCLPCSLFYIAWFLVWFDATHTLGTWPFAEPCQYIYPLLSPFYICPTNEPSHCKKSYVGILTSSVWSINPHNVFGKNIHPNLVPGSTYPTELEQRKRVSWDGWTLLRNAHISAIYTDEAVVQTATNFPAFKNNLEEIRWVKFEDIENRAN